MDESQQDVLSSDVVVVQHASLFLRQHHDAPGSVGKPLKHDDCSLVLGAGLALLFGTSTDVFHSSRPGPQVPCCTFVARPVVSQPACLCAAPDRGECGVELQQPTDRWLFPCAGQNFVMWCGCRRLSGRLDLHPVATWVPNTASTPDETCSPRAQR